jgi:hypothetical protein
VIKKADKKYNSLVSDSIDLQKKKLALEEKISNNGKSQQEQKIDSERQRTILEALKARRRS